MNTNPEYKIDTQSWAMLAILALIWGGSFMFVGVAVKELPALLIVFARLGIAAAILLPLHLFFVGALPRDFKTWLACAGMSILNNVLPFTAISWGQHYISGGLASVINATTPMFGAAFMALFAMEKLTLRKGLALALGLVGVVVLKEGNFGDLGAQSRGILAVTFASACYGISTVWAKKNLMGIQPMTIATCQLTSSAMMMAVLVFAFSTPAQYFQVSAQTWAALIALAALSTSIAYLIFFRINKRSGPSFVVLVTMLVPVSAILLGYWVLNEQLSLEQLVGAAIIFSALLIIDGRVLTKLGIKLA
jgi:drug/metabolite transporter (DMT)-like permease